MLGGLRARGCHRCADVDSTAHPAGGHAGDAVSLRGTKRTRAIEPAHAGRTRPIVSHEHMRNMPFTETTQIRDADSDSRHGHHRSIAGRDR